MNRRRRLGGRRVDGGLSEGLSGDLDGPTDGRTGGPIVGQADAVVGLHH